MKKDKDKIRHCTNDFEPSSKEKRREKLYYDKNKSKKGQRSWDF